VEVIGVRNVPRAPFCIVIQCYKILLYSATPVEFYYTCYGLYKSSVTTTESGARKVSKRGTGYNRTN